MVLPQDPYIFLDAESTHFPDPRLPLTDPRQPYVFELAWEISNAAGDLLSSTSRIVRPDGWEIPREVADASGIHTDYAMDVGIPIASVLEEIAECASAAQTVVAHHIRHDNLLLLIESTRAGCWPPFLHKRFYCTMEAATPIMKLPGRGGYKWPRLDEAYKFFTGNDLDDMHRAGPDTTACREVFFSMHSMKGSADGRCRSD